MAEIYKISKSNGDIIEIQPRSIINKYSLNLVGDDAIGYGERIAETTLRSSENFANTEYPTSATVGQLWCKLISPTLESTPYVSSSSNSDISSEVEISSDPIPELYLCIQTYEETDLVDDENAESYWSRISASSFNVAEFDSISTNGININDKDEDTPGYLYSNTVQVKNLLLLDGYSTKANKENAVFSVTFDDELDTSTLEVSTSKYLINSLTIQPSVDNDTGETLVSLGTSGNKFKSVYSDNTSTKYLTSSSSESGNKILVNSNLVPNLNDPEFGNISNLNIGDASSKFNSVYANQLEGNALSANYADLAEYYYADKAYEPGTIMEVGGEYEVRATLTLSSRRIVGVVSENPGVILNQDPETVSGSELVLIGLLGRVYVKVAGSVSKGDFIESSDIEGVGRSIINYQGHHSRTIVGISLEDNDEEGIKKVLCFIGK